MIELINVTKYYATELGRHYVFRNVSLKLPPDKSVAVVGPNGAGKSTFLGLIAGADTPNEGRIIRSGRISPPMGLTPGLLATLTGSENARFACRIHGMTRSEMDEAVANVERIADIGKYFEMPVRSYSTGMRQRVGFAISMSLNYDYYLFDEIGAGGDRKFREVSQRMVQERLANSKFIMTSHRLDELIDLCEAGIVIMNGELRYFEDIADALAYYGETAGLDVKTGRRKAEAKSAVPKPVAPPAMNAPPKAAGGSGRVPMGLPIAPRPASSGATRTSGRQAQIESWFNGGALDGLQAAARPPKLAAISPQKLALAAKAQEFAAEKTSRAMRNLLLGLDTDPAIGRGRKRAHVLEVAATAQRQAKNAAAKARELRPDRRGRDRLAISQGASGEAEPPRDGEARAALNGPAGAKAANGSGLHQDLQ